MQSKPHIHSASTESIYVGIDVASQWLDVWLDPAGLSCRFANTTHGIADLVEWLRAFPIALVAMEATGRLERACARALADANYQIAVLNPSQISGFRKAIGQLAKTDLLDARAIAQFARTIPLEARPLAERHIEELKDLGARFRQITRMLTAERNRLRRTDHELAASSIKATILFFTDERKKIEVAMKKLVKNHAALKARYDILMSIPGIGSQTALTLVSDLPELGTLDGKKIAALAGVAPMNGDSGLKASRAKLRGGRNNVRAILYMAAMAAQRYNPQISAFYKRLVANGKPGMVALSACMRKLLVIANSMLANQRKWQEA